MEDLGAPGSYMTLGEGVPVYSRDGRRLGQLEHVLAEPDKDIFDGIVFDASPWPGGHRLVDAPEVERIHERGVVLALDAADAERPAGAERQPGDHVGLGRSAMSIEASSSPSSGRPAAYPRARAPVAQLDRAAAF